MATRATRTSFALIACASLGHALVPHAPLRFRPPSASVRRTRAAPSMGLLSFGKSIAAPLLAPEIGGVPVVSVVVAAAAAAKIVVRTSVESVVVRFVLPTPQLS